MASLGSVVVLYSALSDNASIDDLDVLNQARAVSDALEQMGFQVLNLGLSLDNAFSNALRHINPSFVFNLVDSVFSEGRLAYMGAALLEKLGIPYTGCSANSIILTTNKVATKIELKRLGIPTPAWVSATHSDGFVSDDTYIIKALYEDASVGLSDEYVMTFRSFSEAHRVLEERRARSGLEFFAEKLIDGREFNISILGEHGKPVTLCPSETCYPGYDEMNKAKVLDYSAKWEPDSFGYQSIFSVHRFSPKDHGLLEELRAISEKCWEHFDLCGYARVDFRVDKEGKPWVLEINANPCLTPGESGFLKAAEESGFSFHEVIQRIVAERQANCPARTKRGVV